MYCTVCSQEEKTLNGTLRKSCCLPSPDLEVTRKHRLEIGKFLQCHFVPKSNCQRRIRGFSSTVHHQMS